jgi:hypothetical protein
MAMIKTVMITVMFCVAGFIFIGTVNGADNKETLQGPRNVFDVNKADLTDSGRNTYFVLEPGHKLYYEHGKDTLEITVLDETKAVDGVTTRIIEERETSKGQLAEVSRNYYAIDKKSNAVYYFGEDVNIYKDGKIANHEGSWLTGIKGAKFGLMIPAQPMVGDKFYQEMAPGVAMDCSEILSITEKVKTPAGIYENCLHTRDSSDLESGTSEKWYAPGIGLIKDDEFLLVKVEMLKKQDK